jgi:hypothetical protein
MDGCEHPVGRPPFPEPKPAMVAGVLLGLTTLAMGQATPEGRAIAFLAREVPRWRAEHHCASCHNNGDAARALYAAIKGGEALPPAALADTNGWLARPEGWDRNGGEGPFSDKRLARVQFAAALVAAVESGQVRDRGPLVRAARRLAEDQAGDGSWTIDDDAGSVGTPATYGRPLATFMARETLRAADPDLFRPRIARADRWLRGLEPSAVVDAAAVVLAAGASDDPAWEAPRRRALDLLRRGQSPEGGWGPFVNAPPEPFDTAVAVLALARVADRPGLADRLRRGRAFLVAGQADDGSWPETTRPAGGESYAQRLSTTGWATLALLATRSKEGRAR